MRGIAAGESNRQIAKRLVISEHTVRAHLRNVMRKLGVANRAQAAALAAAALAAPRRPSLPLRNAPSEGDVPAITIFVAAPRAGKMWLLLRPHSSSRHERAEGVGFEPTEGCPSHAFQACRFGRSRIPPEVGDGRRRRIVGMFAGRVEVRSGPLAARIRRPGGTRALPLRAASFRT